MKKIYYLATCDTCKRIISELSLPAGTVKQEIKSDPVRPEQLEVMRRLAGSYEALFSRNSRLYREMNLRIQPLAERDYARLILEHYSFLKRPVLIVDDQIFIGNSRKTVAAARETLHP